MPGRRVTLYPKELQRPIWHFIGRRCHRHVKYVLSELKATAADEALAELLSVAAGDPLLEFVEVFYDGKNDGPFQGEKYAGLRILR